MKVALQVFGILIIVCSGFMLLAALLSPATKSTTEILSYSIIGLIIGIVMVISSSNTQTTNKFDIQEFEEFKRYQEQQKQIYYRNANAQGKPISEYLMDDRTKLITYYDRMSQDYKSQLVNYADNLYRKYENQEYLNRK